MADDDGLHTIDSVHADDFGSRHHRDQTGFRARGLTQASPQASPDSRVARPQDDEHVPAALQSGGSGSERAATATGNDEIAGSDHRVALTGACPSTRTGPLSVRTNASS